LTVVAKVLEVDPTTNPDYDGAISDIQADMNHRRGTNK